MVAGVLRALESGRVYSKAELGAALFLEGASLDRTIDMLMESGTLSFVASSAMLGEPAAPLFEVA